MKIMIVLTLTLFVSACTTFKPAPIKDELLKVKIPQKLEPQDGSGYRASELAVQLNESIRALCTNAERHAQAVHFLSGGKHEVKLPKQYTARCIDGD